MFRDTSRNLFCNSSLRFERARLSAATSGRNKLNPALAAAGLVLITMLTFPPCSSFAQKPAASNPTADLPPGPMQAKATTACLECHEARIILQQRLSKAAWTKEVDKMTKWGAIV